MTEAEDVRIISDTGLVIFNTVALSLSRVMSAAKACPISGLGSREKERLLGLSMLRARKEQHKQVSHSFSKCVSCP